MGRDGQGSDGTFSLTFSSHSTWQVIERPSSSLTLTCSCPAMVVGELATMPVAPDLTLVTVLGIEARRILFPTASEGAGAI